MSVMSEDMRTPESSQHRLKKAPMSLQQPNKQSFHDTHPSSTFSSSASKLASSGYSSESFQKTFSEFGQIINQRRAELSEMKRANQFRMAHQLKHDLSTPSSASKSDHQLDHSKQSENGMERVVEDGHDTPEQHVLTPSLIADSGSRLARKLLLSHHKETIKTSHSVNDDIESEKVQFDKQIDNQNDGKKSHWSPTAVKELANQLEGEKERSRELNEKIEELHKLEETQRVKALGLAQEKDKLEAARAELLEQNASLELEEKKLHSLLESRLNRIKELEKQLDELNDSTKDWKEQYAMSEVQKSSIQKEFAAFRLKSEEKEKSLMLTKKELEDQLSRQVSSVQKKLHEREEIISTKQREFEEMSKDNEALRVEMASMQQKYDAVIDKNGQLESQQKSHSEYITSLERQFGEMESANKKLMEENLAINKKLQLASKELEDQKDASNAAVSQYEELNKKYVDCESKCSSLSSTLTKTEKQYASIQLELVVKKNQEKTVNIKHKTKVMVLLFAIFFLMGSVIYEHIVDFHPNTISPYRITS